MKRIVKNPISKGIIQICSHYVEWYLNGKGLHLSDFDIEHITNMLIDNYITGELCTISPNGNTVCGSWSIQM
jgi:hypothetical protein